MDTLKELDQYTLNELLKETIPRVVIEKTEVAEGSITSLQLAHILRYVQAANFVEHAITFFNEAHLLTREVSYFVSPDYIPQFQRVRFEVVHTQKEGQHHPQGYQGNIYTSNETGESKQFTLENIALKNDTA